MLTVLNLNKGFLMHIEHLSKDNIYEVLIKTGQYLKAQDIKYLNMK